MSHYSDQYDEEMTVNENRNEIMPNPIIDKPITQKDVDQFFDDLEYNSSLGRLNYKNARNMTTRSAIILEKIKNHSLHRSKLSIERASELRIEKALNDFNAIYFVACIDAGKIKIGRTDQISKRLQGLKTSSPFELTLINSFVFRKDLETVLHEQFDNERSIGEWFLATKELRTSIKNWNKNGLACLIDECYP